ncbi:MAG: extracellular solute-binding protein [Erysipelothrix sp.]|nr:extracellular solute-binding protein [Erysipelothrix sp.]
MKKLLKSLMLIALVFSLAACGNGKTGEGEETNGASDNVTVYSPHPSETLNLVVKEFEEKTKIKVDVVAAGTGELLKRVESESANPLGDVFWGGGAESLESFKEYFEPYKSPELEFIDAAYYADDFTWTGGSPLPMVLMYNTNLIDEANEPKAWIDLLKPEFKGQIAMADPAKSGSAYTILVTMIQAYGKDDGKGWEFASDFYDAIEGKILGSSTAVYKGVADGEYLVGLTLEKEAQPYVLSGAPVKIIYPEDGTSAVPDGQAIIKGAKNMENAKKFIDFVLSKETQQIMSDQLSRRSIRSDATPPEGLGGLDTIKIIDYNFDWAANEKTAILDQWKEIVIGN